MSAGAAPRGRKRTSLEVKTEAWAVLLACEAQAQATLGMGFKSGEVYERYFREHLDQNTYFHRLGMLRAEGFFHLDGPQKSPETKYYFHTHREKLRRKVRDKWFPKGVPVCPTNPPGISSLPLLDRPGHCTVRESAAQRGADPDAMVEPHPPIKPREHTHPEPAYQVPDSTLRATHFSCPACGCQDLVVKHRLDTRELEHLFQAFVPFIEAHCHSAFLMQCCAHRSHLFLIAFGENTLHQQVVKVLLPGEW